MRCSATKSVFSPVLEESANREACDYQAEHEKVRHVFHHAHLSQPLAQVDLRTQRSLAPPHAPAFPKSPVLLKRRRGRVTARCLDTLEVGEASIAPFARTGFARGCIAARAGNGEGIRGHRLA